MGTAVYAQTRIDGGLVEMFRRIIVGTSTNKVTIKQTGITYAGTAKPRPSMYLNASSAWSSLTAGTSGDEKVETPTNKITYYYTPFDGSTNQSKEIIIPMPYNWDLGTVTAVIYYIPEGTTGGTTIKWIVAAVSVADNETPDQAFGTPITITDTIQTALRQHITPESAAITIGGTLAGGNVVHWRITRDAATDNNTAITRFLGITIFYNINKENNN